MEFRQTNGSDPDFLLLCRRLDQSLEQQVGGAFQRQVYAQYNLTDDIRDVLLVYDGETPIACGSFKAFDPAHAELKRVYVEPAHSGRGLGAQLVTRLEALAKTKGYAYCILETGKPLKAACHLYQKLGYEIMPNYGQYKDMPNSVCMCKKLE